MDKQEYRVILEEINKAYLEENYDRVLMIAQELDVKKVSDNHILEIIADSYEQMGRADIAREVLLIAYERTPMGRQMAYKLCDISIKLNDLDNAAEFYHDFCRMAPNDSKKFILKYEIGKKGGVARKNLVEVLEAYCEKEMDEKYKYELANLYRATGRKEECIELCDEIMLWFAEGAYAKKAQKLKDACLGIMQQNQAPKRRGTLSLFDDENIEDIPEEKAKQYTQPKSEEIFDDAPAVEIQRLEDKPLMNENVSWRKPNKKYDPVITESKSKSTGGLSFNDFDDSYEEEVDDYDNYYSGNKKDSSDNSWNDADENNRNWAMIEDSIQRGWTDPDEIYGDYEDFDVYSDYDSSWEMPEDLMEPQQPQEEFVEPVFGAHRPAHLRDDYVAPEEPQQTEQRSPFTMPAHIPVSAGRLNTPLQPVPQAPVYTAPAAAPTPTPTPTLTPTLAPTLAPSYQEPTLQAPAYQTPNYDTSYQGQAYAPQPYDANLETPREQEEPSLLGAKPFAFSIAPDAAAQNEIVTTSAFTGTIPNMSDKANLVRRPVLKVGPIDEIKYKVPGGDYQTPSDIQVVQYNQPEVAPQQTGGAFTSSTMRQTSIPAPKNLSVDPVKVVMSPDGSQPSLVGKDGRVSLGWDDNWGGDFRTWGSLNMNDAPSEAPEIDEEPDYFSTMLEIPKDKPTFGQKEVPFAQQVPQTKFVELKSGTPFADPRGYDVDDTPQQGAIEYIPKRSGVISAALGASSVAAIASEPEENLTETQKAIRAFGAGELTTDDLLERDDLDLGDDELDDDNVMPSDYGYNDEWQESEKALFDDDDSSELRRFRNSGEAFDFEQEFEDDYAENGFDDGEEYTDAEKAIMAFDVMNKSSNEVVFDEEEDFEEEFDVQEEDDFINYEKEFEEFDNQFTDTKKPKVVEKEWDDSDEQDEWEESEELESDWDDFGMPEEEPIIEEPIEEEPIIEEPIEEEPVVEELVEEEPVIEEPKKPKKVEKQKRKNKEPELSAAEKAILAFDAAGVSDSDEEFDFDEDFDDVFNGEFNGEYSVEKEESVVEGLVEEEIEEAQKSEGTQETDPGLNMIFGSVRKTNKEAEEPAEEFDEEFEEKFDEEFEEDFEEEFEEEFDEDFEEEFEEDEEMKEATENFSKEHDDFEDFDEEYDETEEYDDYEEYDESEEFEEDEEPEEEFEEVEETEETEFEDNEEFEGDEELEEEFEEDEELEELEETNDEESEEEFEEAEEEIPDIQVEIPYELREELSEFFLVEGMEEKIENTLSNIVNAKNKGHKLDTNLIVAGDPKSGKTYLTIALIKAIGKILGNGNGRVAKVPAAALRGKKMEKVFDKVVGSDLIIENIGYLDEDSTRDLIETIKSQKYDSMVVLEGNNLAIENLTSKFPEINEMFKNRLDIDELSLPQWADIANDYANEQGFVIGDMASLALHAKIDELNVPTRKLGTADILEIVDEAIENASNRLSPKVIKKKRKKQEDIELIEDDFA